MAEEVTVTTTPTEDPSVLAEAAVASVGVSAVAAVTAADAKDKAESAERTADAALSIASNTPAGIGEDDARRIIREELEAMAAARAAEPPTEPVVEATVTNVEVENVPAEVAPPSVEKANPDGGGKSRWSDRWHGKE